LKVEETAEDLRPSGTTPSPAALSGRLLASIRYLWTTQVHAYAFSIAANALLSFFPFTVLLLTICRNWLHWQGVYGVIVELLRANLPAGADFIIRNLAVLVAARRRVQVISLALLVFTSSGVFLPLEVALNKVWGIARDRSFLGNMAVSFLLAVASGLMAFGSMVLAAMVQSTARFGLGWLSWQGPLNAASWVLLRAVPIPLTIAVYFVIYYFLPNGPVPVRRVLRASVLAGVLTEVAKFVYAEMLPAFGLSEVYGPFALSATLLLWAFVGSLILLWGAYFYAQGYETKTG
jgi:membrane protein